MIDYNESIEMFEFSARANNQLRNAGIRTVGDLVSKTEDQIWRLHNVGNKTVSEIKEKVRVFGMSLGMNPVNKLALFGTDAIREMSDDINHLVYKLSKFNKEVEIVVDKLKELKGVADCASLYYVWHKYPEDKPPKEGWYLTTRTKGDESFIDQYADYQKDGNLHFAIGNDGLEHIVAWTELPKPYKEEKNERQR